MLRWIGRGSLALALLAGAAAVWQWERLGRLAAVVTLYDEDRIVGNFSSMDAAFPTAAAPAGGAPRPLPSAPRDLPDRFVHGGGEETLESWLERTATTSLIVLKDGVVAHETYRLGTGPDDRRMSFSMAKSVVSVLMGIAIADGDVPGVEARVEDLLPEARGSAYEGARLRDVLNMASGVAFNEDYLDFWSDLNRMSRALALGRSMDAFSMDPKRPRARPPGSAFDYVSIDTHVLAMILRRATGRDLPGYLSEKLWTPMGAEADALFITDEHGAAFALGGLNARTRDFARFALLIAEGGARDGEQIVPADWIADSTAPSAPPPADPAERWDYGYQWWAPPGREDAPGGEIVGRGIYGQWMYLRPDEGVVVVKTSADRGFRDPDRDRDLPDIAAFRAIADAMRRSFEGDGP